MCPEVVHPQKEVKLRDALKEAYHQDQHTKWSTGRGELLQQPCVDRWHRGTKEGTRWKLTSLSLSCSGAPLLIQMLTGFIALIITNRDLWILQQMRFNAAGSYFSDGLAQPNGSGQVWCILLYFHTQQHSPRWQHFMVSRTHSQEQTEFIPSAAGYSSGLESGAFCYLVCSSQ